MKASSFRDYGDPWRGRLHNTQLQWTTDSQRPNEFLELRLAELFKIISVATQGGSDCWVKSFGISYRDKNMKWKQYKGKNGGVNGSFRLEIIKKRCVIPCHIIPYNIIYHTILYHTIP